MAHISEYIIKGQRPRKPIMVLWGTAKDFTPYFKSKNDLSIPTYSSGQVISHASTKPLFTEMVTLWVNAVPDFNHLRALRDGDIHQPIIFNCVTPDDEVVLEAGWKKKVQIISNKTLSSGTKNQKDFIKWFLSQEFTTVEDTVLDCFVEVASSHIDEGIVQGSHNLAKIIYQTPREFLQNPSSCKKYLMTFPSEKWQHLLAPETDNLLFQITDAFFQKNHSLYEYLDAYLQVNDQPLGVISILMKHAHQYLECAWAGKEVKGLQQNSFQFAQSRKIPKVVLDRYEEKILNFFGEKILWNLVKDLCIVQSRYKAGEKSLIPFYSMIIKYIQAGL